MKCEARKIKIPKETVDGIKPFVNRNREFGGGMNFDEKGRLKNMTIFESNNSDKKTITFVEKYDVEFHTHPIFSKSKDEAKAVKRASASDIASFFVSMKEEIIFVKGYIFQIRLDNRELFEKTKKDISKKYAKAGKKFSLPYEKYFDFFGHIESNVRSKTTGTIDFIQAWNKKLQEYGVKIVKLDPDEPEFTLHGKCES